MPLNSIFRQNKTLQLNSDVRWLFDKGPPSILIAGDFHLGLEGEINNFGVLEDLSDNVINEFISTVKILTPKKILLLGDIEHTFAHVRTRKTFASPYRFQSKKISLIKSLFSQLLGITNEVLIVKGNHDINISKAIPQEITTMTEWTTRFEGKKTCFAHGHIIPKNTNAEKYIFGHVHPAIRLKDASGVSYTFPTFLSGKISRQVLFPRKRFDSKSEQDSTDFQILPAYNPNIIGTPITSHSIASKKASNKPEKQHKKPDSFSFLKKVLFHAQIEATLTNGVFLGDLAELEN